MTELRPLLTVADVATLTGLSEYTIRQAIRDLELPAMKHSPESEPVLIEAVGEAVVFVLDDGERLEFDATELRSALGIPAADAGRLRAA